MRGRKFSAEHKANLSVAMTGLKRGPHSNETKAKIATAHTGLKHSEDTKAKMSATRTGAKRGPLSKEHRSKLSKALKGRVPWNKLVAHAL